MNKEFYLKTFVKKTKDAEMKIKNVLDKSKNGMNNNV